MRSLSYIVFLILALHSCAPNEMFFADGESKDPIHYSYDQGQVILSFDNSLSSGEIDSLMETVGISRSEVDIIQHSDTTLKTSNGWELIAYSPDVISFKKPLTEFGIGGDDLSKVWLGDRVQIIDYSMLDVPYGVNDFAANKKMGVERPVVFKLDDHQYAKNVYLSGTFNNWSTLSQPMTFSDGKWHTEFNLEPGKHFYKFIVDGQWHLDPMNRQSSGDGMGNTNSVLFVYNHTFTLDGMQGANEVFLVGSFNDWKENELRMSRTDKGWELPLYLRVGTHAYKFLVDGHWMTDPSNSQIRPDGKGNENSYMSIGDSLIFRLNDHVEAQEVYLAGDFNAWQYGELKMHRNLNGWSLPYVLRPGNYEYRYIVDGQWTQDFSSPSCIGKGEEVNSVMCVEPNTTFALNGYSGATQVYLSGTFNDWAESGYAMQREGDTWTLDIHLGPGKHRYKFIVDGIWMEDPHNPLWEWNEHDTKNSILWKE